MHLNELKQFSFPTAMQSTEGPPVEHVTVYGSASGSVRSASPNVQTTLASPMLTVQQTQTQATAFVQPTQQQSLTHTEPANQELPPVLMEAAPSSQVERPTTSSTSTVFGTGEGMLMFGNIVDYTFFFSTKDKTIISSFSHTRNLLDVQEASRGRQQHHCRY